MRSCGTWIKISRIGTSSLSIVDAPSCPCGLFSGERMAMRAPSAPRFESRGLRSRDTFTGRVSACSSRHVANARALTDSWCVVGRSPIVRVALVRRSSHWRTSLRVLRPVIGATGDPVLRAVRAVETGHVA